MGVMFLVMTPCLYCNVSDSWMLPNRWHRAAIGAAGMYVEVCLASICTFICWFSVPGPLNYFCLNVMFVSSVITIMFNANPLSRYDGSYLLSVIFEIPMMNDDVKNAMHKDPNTEKVRSAAKVSGMLSLRHVALHKAIAGQTSLAEVIRISPK